MGKRANCRYSKATTNMHKKVHSIHIYACMLSRATKPRCNYLLHCTLRRLLNIDAVRTTATRTSRWRLTNCAAGLTDERVDGGRTRCNSNLPVCVCVCLANEQQNLQNAKATKWSFNGTQRNVAR